MDGLTGLFTGLGPTPGPRRERVLRSIKLADVKKEIETALAELQSTKKILVVDQLDALLAVTGEDLTSLKAQETVLSLREVSISHHDLDHKLTPPSSHMRPS